jgi:micrococcal nuclease
MGCVRRPLVTLVVVILLGVGAYVVSRDDEDDGTDDGTVGEPATTTAPPADTTAPPADAGNGAELATVRSVADGDSFTVVLVGGREAEVRMIGVNAPEFGECVSVEARRTLTALVGTGQIQLVRDVTDRDRFDRMLRYVVVNGVDVNVEMARRGLALAGGFEPDVARQPDIDAAQRSARAAGLGLWNPNACGPAASTAVQIVEVEEDPPGRDSDDLNGEYVVIRNSGTAPVAMTGWKLRDTTTQNRFWFPEGFTLGPGANVTVRVGSGQDGSDVLYWGRRSTVWDNDGDIAFLLDPRGNAVSIVDVPMR